MERIVVSAFANARVYHADGIRQAKESLNAYPISLALIEAELWDGDGVDLLVGVRKIKNMPYMVVVSRRADRRGIISAFKSGGSGYLLKTQACDEIVRSLRQIEFGFPPLSPKVARCLVDYLRHEDGALDELEEWELQMLSPREREVLILLAKGLNRREIGGLLDLTTNTISSYIKSIYRKLDVNSRAEATLFAVRCGLAG